jgi:hypothetical protein
LWYKKCVSETTLISLRRKEMENFAVVLEANGPANIIMMIDAFRHEAKKRGEKLPPAVDDLLLGIRKMADREVRYLHAVQQCMPRKIPAWFSIPEK